MKGIKKVVGLGVAGLIGISLISSAGKTPQKSQTQDPASTAATIQQPAVKPAEPAPKVKATEVKTETKTEAIPFTSVSQNDATLASGQTSVIPGVNGVQTITYSVTYTNGVETGRVETSSVITTAPVNQIIKVGTKVAAPAPTYTSCSDGYINSVGNCVHSPSSSPAGATAQCGDGSYSYSQSRSGTCSHHGGVSVWL